MAGGHHIREGRYRTLPSLPKLLLDSNELELSKYYNIGTLYSNGISLVGATEPNVNNGTVSPKYYYCQLSQEGANLRKEKENMDISLRRT